jgi:hypothetical protein
VCSSTAKGHIGAREQAIREEREIAREVAVASVRGALKLAQRRQAAKETYVSDLREARKHASFKDGAQIDRAIHAIRRGR